MIALAMGVGNNEQEKARARDIGLMRWMKESLVSSTYLKGYTVFATFCELWVEGTGHSVWIFLRERLGQQIQQSRCEP